MEAPFSFSKREGTAMKMALIIVDMLVDFVDKEGALYCGESASRIIPKIKELARKMRKLGAAIIYLADSHGPDDREFELFPPHCVKGTPGAQITDELRPKTSDYVVPKNRFSGFYNTNLDEILKKERPDEVHIVGVCTSICVMDTVSGLRDRDYKVVVHRDAVADFDSCAHQFALKRMEKVLGAQVI